MTYLGYTLVHGVITSDDDKVEKLRKAPLTTTTPKKTHKKPQQPKNKSLLGLAEFYQRFIPGFVQFNCITRIMPAKVYWTQECEDAFQTLSNIQPHPSPY